MSASRALGINLGTSFVAIARVDELGRSSMFRNALGDLLLDSTVFFEDDELIYGRAARQAAAAQPERAAENAKRDLGQRAYARAIGGELLPAEVIEACLLKKAYAEVAATGPRPGVVLSIPACFDQAQRKAMLDVAHMAGVDPLGMINDPAAAALAFAENQGYLNPTGEKKPGCRVLVFDLGGGKLDVAIIELKPGTVRTLAVGGDARLGGRDWDARLADHLAEQFAKQFGEDPRYDMKSVRRLVESAAEAKHTLTVRQQARVHIEREQLAADITITRQAFDDLTADLVARARKITEGVLSQAAMAWPDVAHLLLMGGATRMPMIGKMLEALTGLTAAVNLQPDEAVARGAALRAASLLAEREGRMGTPLEIVDLSSHSLGIQWSDPQMKRTENVVIIPRGTQLPYGTGAKVATTEDDQRTIRIQLIEGESRQANECSPVAEVTISGLPGNLPANSPIDVHYQYTADRRVQVRARLPGSEAPLTIEAKRLRGLTVEQAAEWRRVLSGEIGLKPILAHLAKQPKTADSPSQSEPVSDVPPQASDRPALPMGTLPRGGGEPSYDFDPEEAVRSLKLKSRKKSPRQLAILLGGYVVFSAIGLLIGYYILMRIEPSYNYYHLRLPGLAGEPPSTGPSSE